MIPIRNIYYMLAYAFQVLNEQGYKKIATEEFNNVAELCAEILIRGISIQVKRGLARDYIECTELLLSPRGKADISASIKTKSLTKKKLICTYDDFSENFYLNRILKTTMILLMHADISNIRKKELRKILLYFGDVDVLDFHNINWNVQYHRNNQTYRMLVSICYLVIKGLLQSNSDGSTYLMDFLDEQRMCKLYEKFILKYYQKEFPQISATASQIPWAVDDDVRTMLPVMQSDIMLNYGEKTLIIDAKYYSRTTQTQFGSHTLHSNNLYQIFTYVKNKDASLSDSPHEVAGLLLYAQTDEVIQPNNTYIMSGNKIGVQSLDLNRDFSSIAHDLNEIIRQNFVIIS